MLSRIRSRAFRWTKTHLRYVLELEERPVATWVFIRTWDGDSFRSVAIGVLDQFRSDASPEMSVVGNSASEVAISGGSHILAETYEEFLGSGFNKRLIEVDLIFNLRLFKTYHRRCSVARTLFSGTRNIVNHLRRAEHRD